MMKKKMMTTLLLAGVALTAYSCNRGAGASSTPQTAATQQSAEGDDEPDRHLSLLFAGDLMQHGPQIKAALRADGSYNYDECFAAVKDEIERADVAIANLEVTLAGPPYTGYPQFRAPDDFLRAVADAGFDVLLTANNHCLDSRRQGLERTIAMLDSLGVPHLGTYVNAQEREQCYPFLLEQNGIRVVLLNFTYDTNGIPVEQPGVVNLIDTAQIARDIERARGMNPDVIIALPHWGIEYQTLPSQQQRQLAQWLLDKGVDHVIGGHPHVAQPLELSPDSCHLVAWSMGNVISNQSKPNTYGGYMVRLELTKTMVKGERRTRLSDCGYVLYWVSRPADNGGRHNYRILPIDMPDDALTATERQKLGAIRTSMRRLMEKHNVGTISEILMKSEE